MPVDINEAQSRFEDGIDGQAAQKWRQNAEQRSGDYADEFDDILSEQNDCAQQAREETDGGYSALVAYANCISG